MSNAVATKKKTEVKENVINNIKYNNKKFVWFDLRNMSTEDSSYKSIINSISEMESAGFVVDGAQAVDIPEKFKKIVFVKGVPANLEQISSKYNTLIFESKVIESEWFTNNRKNIKNKVGTIVNVYDAESLQKAVQMTHILPLLVVEFKDETKIPLEIVLADAQNYNSKVIMKVQDNLEAKIVLGVLECGADGVMVKVDNLTSLYSVYEEIKYASENLKQELQEMTIVKTCYAGMGERGCIDLTSKLEKDEGILMGSFSNGGILACSETHPLPYMKTRPFRVNAGSLQSYIIAPDNQTWYLSDLRAGMELLAVKTNGQSRHVTVGRIKIEKRPILQIVAKAPDNTEVNMFMQNDWHVRIFGIDGKPVNITTLKPGDKVLGYTMESGRHVGVKVNETIIEQ